jgi:hypothetical protein
LAIGIFLPKTFWHLATIKKRRYQSYKGFFFEKAYPNLQYSEDKKGMSLSDLDHNFYNMSPEYSEVSKKFYFFLYDL